MNMEFSRSSGPSGITTSYVPMQPLTPIVALLPTVMYQNGLLRVLDHPQAVYVLQRRLCSRARHTEIPQQHQVGIEAPVTSPISYCNSSMEICLHCSHVKDIICCSSELTSLHPSSSSPSESLDCHWTLQTLHHLIQALAISSCCSSSLERFSLNDLSSTAIHNLLMLVEQNWKQLPTCTATLEQFIANIKLSPFVIKDEWCNFLIGRLKQHMEPSVSVPLIDFGQPGDALMESGSGDSSSLFDEITVVSDSPLAEKDDMETAGGEEEAVIADGEPPVGLVLSQQGIAEVSVPRSVSQSLSQEQLGVHPVSPSLPISEAGLELEPSSHRDLVNRIYQEWFSSKPAEQADFEEFCSLSNIELSKSLNLLDACRFPESAVIGINKNISSLKLGLSYHNAVNLIHAVLLPMVSGLGQSPSRELVSTLCSINILYPDCLTHALLLPLLHLQTFGAVHSNLLVKVLEDTATREQLDDIWKNLLDIQVDSSGAPFCWNEDVVVVVLVLLHKVTLTPVSLGKLIGLLQRNAEALSKCSKFAKLMMELCKSQQYREMVCSYSAELLEMATMHRSLFKSALLREIKKLSSPNY